MVAVIASRPELDPTDVQWSPAPSPARPDLRVVAGGRARRAARPTAATYRRRRLAALVGVAVLATLLAATVRLVAPATGGGPFPAPGQSPAAAPISPDAVGARYVVQPGDTLWSIARRVDPRRDPRSVVDQIIARNGGPAVQPGQVLVLS